MESKIENEITNHIEKTIGDLSSKLQAWARSHLIAPKLIELNNNLDCDSKSKYWLVTDNTGQEDSSYRVVFDEDSRDFGLESTLENGKQWLVGIYGTFAETIENI